MTHLLIFTIGPVQSLIASARKTQDLFAGSAILSNLTYQAFEELKRLAGSNFAGGSNVEEVTPATFERSLADATNPNRFVAVVKNKTTDELRAISNAVKNYVIEKAFTEKALLAIKLPSAIKPYAEAQLLTFPEVFWVASEINANGNYTSDEYKQLESWLGGIKNIRRLEQMNVNGTIGEQGRKCNVDGVHNVVVYRKNDARDNSGKLHNSNVHLLDHDDEASVKIWEVGIGEGLSAVSYYKRKLQSNPHFYPSTAKIALLHIVDHPQVQALKEFREFGYMINLWEDKNEDLRRLSHSDEQLFYEENINDNVLSKSGKLHEGMTVAQAKDDLKKAWRNMADKVEAIVPDKFSTKYYALLQFDGDDMGEWLSGQNCTGKVDGSSFEVREFQNHLSHLLQEFANAARDGINKPMRGKAVYSAGEDFLGFVNLNCLLPVLKELRLTFDEVVNQKLKIKYVTKKSFTFSAGVVIAHYKQPLPTVLDWAREAEKKAKGTIGKNCVCFSVMRHSGSPTHCIIPFGNDFDPVSLIRFSALEEVVGSLSQEKYSNKFIHQLIRQTQHWDDISDRALFDTETARLVKRARNKEKVSDSQHDQFVRQIHELSYKNGTMDLKRKQKNNFLSALRIADFIKRNIKAETR